MITLPHPRPRARLLVEFSLAMLLVMTHAVTMYAQSLMIDHVDATAFPSMRASFYALNPDGSIARPSSTELALTENGVPVSKVAVACKPSLPPVSLSSVLVVDVSGSMLGDRMDVARAGVRAWIDALSLGRSECAITSFNHDNYLNQDFTTDRNLLLAASDALQPIGGTDYDKGLLLPSAGGLQVSASGRYKRIIIFLTDGLPNRAPRVEEIVAEANRQGCVVYAITMGLTCPSSLRDISTRTGGAWYESVSTTEELEAIYRRISLHEQYGQESGLCEVTWRAADVCSTGNRAIALTWGSASATGAYQVDRAAIRAIAISPSTLHMTPRAIGIAFDTTITVTALRQVTVRSFTSSNGMFVVTPATFTMEAGETRELRVRFTPQDSGYQWTRFSIATSSCSEEYMASAGYPQVRSSQPTLVVTHPNGGQEFVVGIDTVITWDGIPTTDRVRVEASTDDGRSWTTLTDSATGGRFVWRVPNTPSRNCRIRVSQLSASTVGDWVRRIGVGGSSVGHSVAVDGRGNSYVCGQFKGRVQMGGDLLTSVGADDLFVAKFNANGDVLWARRAGGSNFDKANSIALDALGNIIIGGDCGADADFLPAPIPATQVVYTFVAKYAPDGTRLWTRPLGGNNGGTPTGAIAVDASNDILVTGHFAPKPAEFGGIVLRVRDNSEGFVAKVGADGDVMWARQFGANDFTSFETGTAVHCDRNGSVVITGHFRLSALFNGQTIVSAGDEDAFMARYSRDGVLEWVRRAGGSKQDNAQSIAIDSAGNSYVGGISFGASTFEQYQIPAGAGTQMFIAKYRRDGTVDWVRTIASEPPLPPSGFWINKVPGMSIDRSGDIHITGEFIGTLNVQGMRVQSRGLVDIFTAAFRADGSAVSVQRAGTPWYSDNSGDIAVEGIEARFVTGWVQQTFETADFGADSMSTTGGRDGFLWRIDLTSLQADTSDAPFAIVAPAAASHDVDMGRVVVGRSRDSVITTFIRNTGAVDFLVRRIVFAGSDSSQFSTVSGLPFTVRAGQSHPVEFRFRADSMGVQSARVHVFIGGDTLRQTIVGEGIAPSVIVVSETIDFGRVIVGNARDTLRVVTIANIGTSPVTITATRYEGPNTVDFTSIAGGGSFTLSPGDTMRLDLRFAPTATGRTSGRLVFDFDGDGTPASVQLFGEGVSARPAVATVVASSAAARVGEEIEVQITMRDGINIAYAGVTAIIATLRFNASLLFPLDSTPVGVVVGGERLIEVKMPLVINQSPVLATLRFLALLGNDSTTALALENPIALGGDATVTAGSGEFRLLDLCYADGPRLYYPDGYAGILKVQPNPSREFTNVEIQTSERGRTRLTVVDMFGRDVMTLVDDEHAPGTRHVTIDARTLATGSYYLVLTTPTSRRAERWNVAK